MNPIKIKESITQSIINQTLELRPVHEVCRDIESKFAREYEDTIKNYNYFSSPYLEKIPYYAQDENTTLATLVQEQVEFNGQLRPALEKETAMLFAAEFGNSGNPGNVSLYRHQADAVRAAAKGDNLIICTGTGSGKTESFLIPALNAIIKERKEQGEQYRAGVRVMILYPMNALVNDQVRRLRSIIRHAVREKIEYAKDITYGIYTSELDKRQHNKPTIARNIDQEGYKVAQNQPPAHPYLSGNECPPNEYSSRRRWQDNPADILITNYSMLEHLMLAPEKSNIFYNGASTWKYIILDEAHTYDGAVGTDIAWLIRRVVQRTQSKDMRYMATSATLVDDDSENDKKVERIQKEFASKIFPAEPGSFSVQLGAEHKDEWKPEAPHVRVRSFLEICNLNAAELVQQLNNCLEQVNNPDLKSVFKSLSKSVSLVEFTKRFIEIKKWLGKQRFITTCQLQNRMAWGDVHWIAGFLQSLNRSQEIGVKNSKMLDVIAQWLSGYGELRDAIVKKMGMTSSTEATRCRDSFKSFATNENGVHRCNAAAFSVLSEFLHAECKNYVNVAFFELELSEDTQQLVGQIKNDIEVLTRSMSEIETDLRTAWQSALNVDGTSCEDIITAYLKQGAELHDFWAAISDKPEHRTMERIATRVFPDAENQAVELDAFSQLLALSAHDKLKGKPLMDIRYHQTVSGISDIAVKFVPDGRNSYTLKLKPDAPEIADQEDGVPLYTFALCYKCAHPFIQAYGRQLEGVNGTYELSRYRSSFEQGGLLYTFSWVKSDEPEADEDVDRYYFNPQKARLLMTNDECEEDGYIRVYHYKRGSVERCPVCQRRANKGDAVAPFKTGLDRLKTGVLYALVENTDPEVCSPASSLAGGRKLLAFSDSRNGAARLAVNFGRYCEERLVEKNIVEISQSDECSNDKIKEYLRAFSNENNNQFVNSDFDSKSIELQLIENIIQGFDENIREQMRLQVAPMQNAATLKLSAYLKDSMLSYLPLLKERLDAEQGYVMYEKESKYGKCFSEPASLSLCMLAALRNTGRKGLVKRNAIKVYSYAHRNAICDNDESWRRIADYFVNEERATAYFDLLYERLFLLCNIKCDNYDNKAENQECSYTDDTDSSLNGFDGYRRDDYAIEGAGVVKLISNLGHKLTEFQKELRRGYLREEGACNQVLNAIHEFLVNKNIIIASDAANQATAKYRLNLNDVRLRRGDGEVPGNNMVKQYFRIEEHTAQLSSSQGRIHQNMFASGAVNILSCSTTFEMGVDLGSLNCVFMNNMPPTVSNYKQRAGRAGRRPGSSSYVLTLISDSSHDLYYKNNPHELFFGKVDMPRVQLDIPAFMYRHMRAEALYSYLAWWKSQNANMQGEWRTCDNFFGGDNAVIASLLTWRENEGEINELNQRCCGVRGAVNQQDYNPADDLIFQLMNEDGWEVPEYFRNEGVCLDLGGCHLWQSSDLWTMPLKVQYQSAVHGMNNIGVSHAAIAAVKERQITAYFAETGVLPKFGFPSDVIQLLPALGELSTATLRLSRDVRQGLFEYAPGRHVIANKRKITSSVPLFWTPQEQNGEQMYQLAGVNRYLWKCQCNKFFLDGDNDRQKFRTCPHCGRLDNNHQLKRAIRPDAFRASVSVKARAFDYNDYITKVCMYSGGIGYTKSNVSGSNLTLAASKDKSVIYINEMTTEDYNALVHTVRSEAALWGMTDEPADWHGGCMPQGWDSDRYNAAWESALQAIIRASSIVNGTPTRDLEGQVAIINEKRYIVLFDGGSGASTSILRLVIRDEQQGGDNTQTEKLSLKILDEAYRLCAECKCSTSVDGDKTPMDAGAVYADGAENRNFRACYNCLMRYDNQRVHSKLDAHDAAVILKAMLGPSNADGGKSGQECGNEGNGGIKVNNHTASGKTIDDDMIKDIKFGKYDDKDFMVRVDGNAIPLTLLYAIDEDEACAFINEEGEEFILAFDDIIETIN